MWLETHCPPKHYCRPSKPLIPWWQWSHQQENSPCYTAKTAEQWPEECDEKIVRLAFKCQDRDQVKHPWDVLDHVRSVEAPLWIRPDSYRQPGFLWCTAQWVSIETLWVLCFMRFCPIRARQASLPNTTSSIFWNRENILNFAWNFGVFFMFNLL